MTYPVPPIRAVMQVWMEACEEAGLEGAQPGSLMYRRPVVGPPGDLVAVLTYRMPGVGTRAALIQGCRGCWTWQLNLPVREAVRRARLIALPLFSIEGGRSEHAAAAV